MGLGTCWWPPNARESFVCAKEVPPGRDSGEGGGDHTSGPESPEVWSTRPRPTRAQCTLRPTPLALPPKKRSLAVSVWCGGLLVSCLTSPPAPGVRDGAGGVRGGSRRPGEAETRASRPKTGSLLQRLAVRETAGRRCSAKGHLKAAAGQQPAGDHRHRLRQVSARGGGDGPGVRGAERQDLAPVPPPKTGSLLQRLAVREKAGRDARL